MSYERNLYIFIKYTNIGLGYSLFGGSILERWGMVKGHTFTLHKRDDGEVLYIEKESTVKVLGLGQVELMFSWGIVNPWSYSLCTLIN